MIIKIEQQYHFGVISKQQQLILSQRLRREAEQTPESNNLSDIERCDRYVARCSAAKPSKQLLGEIGAFIDSKYPARHLYWYRLILLTQTPLRDKCLALLYESISTTTMNSSHTRALLFILESSVYSLFQIIDETTISPAEIVTIQVAEQCAWNLFALSLEGDILPDGLENFWSAKYADRMDELIDKLSGIAFLRRAASTIDECCRYAFGIDKIELTLPMYSYIHHSRFYFFQVAVWLYLPMYQVWELAKHQAEHKSVDVDWDQVSPVSGTQILVTVGSIVKENNYAGHVYRQMMDNLLEKSEDSIFAWTGLEMLSSALIETLNPRIRKTLLTSLSTWCNQTTNSQVHFMLRRILVQLRDESNDDILKRFAVMHLRKVKIEDNDELFSQARRCPSNDIITRVNIRLEHILNSRDNSIMHNELLSRYFAQSPILLQTATPLQQKKRTKEIKIRVPKTNKTSRKLDAVDKHLLDIIESDRKSTNSTQQ